MAFSLSFSFPYSLSHILPLFFLLSLREKERGLAIGNNSKEGKTYSSKNPKKNKKKEILKLIEITHHFSWGMVKKAVASCESKKKGEGEY